MSESTLLEFDGIQVPVLFDLPNNRARLTIERDGSLLLHAGGSVEPGDLLQFLSDKREWIYRKLAFKSQFEEKSLGKELVDGEGLQYLGRNYQLRLVESSCDSVRLVNGRLLLPLSRKEDGAAAIISWYCDRGRRWFEKRSEAYAKRLSVAPRALDVREIGDRWGLASPTRGISLHWATFQLRPHLVDYVIVHELAHLRIAHHGQDFWRLVGRVLPDFEERKEELARIGAGLWFGALAAPVSWEC